MDESIFLFVEGLKKEREILDPFKSVIPKTISLLDYEINRLSTQTKPIVTQPIKLTEILYIPADIYPNYNFIGKILGPRGNYLKRLEKETNCKILIRGKGSMRDKELENSLKGKPGYEHLNYGLHVYIEGDSENSILHAKSLVEPLLIPIDKEKDILKEQQLKELVIIKSQKEGSNTKPHIGSHNRYEPY